MKTIKGKMYFIYGIVLIALLLTVISAYVAVDTQEQHLVLTELLTKHELYIEKITRTVVTTGEVGLSNPNRFMEKKDTNAANLATYFAEVDTMLTAMTDKMYVFDGRDIQLKFNKEYNDLFNTALSSAKGVWKQAMADIEWLMDSSHLSKPEVYEERLAEFDELNFDLLESSSELIFICRAYAEISKSRSNIIQFITLFTAFMILIFMMYFMERDFKQPLKEIQNVFIAMGQGRLGIRLKRLREDEFKALFNDFNHFADALQVMRDIEAHILQEDSIYEIMQYIKVSFQPFAAFDRMVLVYKNSSNTISQLEVIHGELIETIIDEFKVYKTLTKENHHVVVPVNINNAYLGYVSFYKSEGFDEASCSFIETLNQTLSFTFYKSLLFKDLLAIVTDGLADLAESRDPETRLHLLRMSSYAQIIARSLMKHDKFKSDINNTFLSNIKLTAPMHDIGKVSVPDHILLKPGKLTEEEYEIMKTHAYEGSVVLRKIHERFCQYNLYYFDMAAEIALGHQEKFDGAGYPKGLSGTSIPLAARISALADVFDALTSKRPYKEAFSLNKSYDIIRASKGSHFDPEIVDAFFDAIEDIESIYNKYKET